MAAPTGKGTSPHPLRRAIRRPLGVLLVLLGIVLPALAVIPQFWEIRAYDDWRQGDLEGLSITGEGDLVLAPAFEELFDTGEPLVFSAASDGEGNVYLGTGHEGRVFRVDSRGVGTLLAELGELDVLALAVGPGAAVYAATSPGGRVYRLAADGTSTVFFDPDDLYIWDLQFDGEGRLLVATGEEGVIYRVDANGNGEVFYDSENIHILSLATDLSGAVIAGGSPGGYVYRISPEGRAFVTYDSGMAEVRSITTSPDGRIYAAVLDAPGVTASASAPSALSSGSARVSGSVVVSQAASPASRNAIQVTPGGASAGAAIGGGAGRGPGTGTPSSRILEILPNGAVTSVWESNDEMVFSVLHVGDRLLFSSGTRGRIYALGQSRRPSLLVESTEEQTTRLLAVGDRFLATSSNGGKLWELGDGARASGRYQSPVRDTGAISTWGKVSSVGQGVRLGTRSGNTEVPDTTWSDWAAVDASGAVASPSARFIQWQATLDRSGADEPILRSVTLPYLQQNFRPDVSSLEILQPGLALREQQPTASPNAVARAGVSGRVVPAIPRPGSRTVIETGAQALRWTAQDQNGDVLRYTLFYREEGESGWKPLADGLEDTFFTIDPDTLPDGMYRVRLVASDIGSNPPGEALTGEFETPPFAIDNSPPTVDVGQVAGEGALVTLEVRARDQTSVLKQAEVSVDAGAWRPVFPVDGIVDSLAEEFRFVSGPMDPGEHVVAFRIYDQNENVGIGKTIVQIP